MTKWLIGLVLMAVVGAAAWVAVPMVHGRTGSWCDRVRAYEYGQRLTHFGNAPWDADIRVGLSGCNVGSDHQGPVYRPKSS